MSLKYRHYQVEADEVGQEVAHGYPARLAVLAALVQREHLLVLEGIQEALLLVGEGEQRTALLGGVLPYLEVHGGGEDVLVGYADVGLGLVLLVQGTDGFRIGLVYLHHQHGATLYHEGLCLYLHLWLAIHLGSCFYHIDFLFRMDAGYLAVVLHTHQQASASGVGKGRNATGYLTRIGYLELEILMLVLSLCYQLAYILCICLNSHDGAKVGKICGNSNSVYIICLYGNTSTFYLKRLSLYIQTSKCYIVR